MELIYDVVVMTLRLGPFHRANDVVRCLRANWTKKVMPPQRRILGWRRYQTPKTRSAAVLTRQFDQLVEVLTGVDLYSHVVPSLQRDAARTMGAAPFG